MGTGSIYLRNRPVRTAYLLDLDLLRPGTTGLASAIDGIVSYAVENWGARRDSIHFFHGSNGFTDDEWFDLENADPDRIYTFAELSQQNLERLHRLRPWSINGYVGVNPEGEPGTPMLPGVPVIPTREALARVDAELLLFAFTQECAPITRSFLHRNFGSYRQWSDPRSPQVIRWIAWMENLQREGRHLILRISYQDSVNDVFNRLAGNLQQGQVYRPPLRFIAPIEIPAALRPTGASSWTWAQGYNVFVGDSPQLFAAYWTDSRGSGFWAEPFRHRLWIPTSIFSAPGFAESLGMYLWQYSGSHSSTSRFITIVSDDGAHSAVETMLPSFASSRYSVRPTHQKLADWESQRRQRIRRDRRDEFPRSRLDSNSANRFRILEDTPSFPIERPSISMSPDTTWAVEVQIEQDETDGVGSRTNVTLLPKERGSDMAPFIFRAISRVDRHHLFVVRRDSRSGPFDAAAAPEIQVRQISSASLFPAIISSRLIGFDADDLRHGRIQSATAQNIYSTSEPGKHLRGIISLFGNLDSSRSFTDRRLWEKVFQYLSGARISQDEQLESDVHNLLFKRLKSSMKRPEAEKLATSAAKGTVRLVQARTVERFVTLAKMQQWCEEIATAAGTGATKIEYGSDKHRVQNAGANALTADELTEELGYLIDRDIFHLGVNLQCPSCSGQQWYQAKSLGQRVECAGCGNSYSLPPSPEWSYKLNSLVRRAVPSGTMFVLQALREMADRASFSFYYSPSLDVHNGTKLLGELDIICLVNGELVLGEAKSGRPNKAEFEQYQTRVLDLRPDRAMIFVSQEHLADARPLFDEIRVEVEKQAISIELFSLPLY